VPFTIPTDGQDIAAALFQQFRDVWLGSSVGAANTPLNLVSVNNAAARAAVIRNLDPLGGALRVRDSTGRVDLLKVTDGSISGLFSGLVGEAANVRSYGAVGDGSADDAPAFNAAIAAVGAGGGTVFVPAGTYMLYGRLDLGAPGTRLLGTGPASVLKAGSQAQLDWIVDLRADGCSVADLCLDGNRDNRGMRLQFGRLVYVDSAVAHSAVSSCELRNAEPFGVQIATESGTRDVLIEGCWFHDIGQVNDRTGWAIFTSGSPGPTDVKILWNRFERLYGLTGPPIGEAIAFDHVSNASIIGNTITDTFNGGGMIGDGNNGASSRWRIVGNHLQMFANGANGYHDIATSGLELTGLGYFIAGNTFDWAFELGNGVVFEPIGGNDCGEAMVLGNVFNGPQVGVAAIDTATTGRTRDVLIVANRCGNCATALSWGSQITGDRCCAFLNDLNDSAGTPLVNTGGALCFANLGANGPQVTGSCGGNAALASLATQLAALRWIDNATT
jgi:hypothetical protein